MDSSLVAYHHFFLSDMKKPAPTHHKTLGALGDITS